MSAAVVRGVPATRRALRDMRAALRHLEAAERLLVRAGMDPDPDDRDENALDSLMVSLHHLDHAVKAVDAACPTRRVVTARSACASGADADALFPLRRASR